MRENETRRRELQGKLRDLSKQRQAYIADAVKNSAAEPASLDHKIYSAIKERAAKKSIIYDQGPSY